MTYLADLLGPRASAAELCGATAPGKVPSPGMLQGSWRSGEAEAKPTPGYSRERGGTRSAFRKVPDQAACWSEGSGNMGPISGRPSSVLPPATSPSEGLLCLHLIGFLRLFVKSVTHSLLRKHI